MPERRFLNRAALTAACVALGLATAGLYAEDWPQWRGVDRTGVWTDTGIVEQLPDAGLKVTWRVPVRGGFAGPAVAGGRVFVLDYEETPGSRTMDGTERLLALDEETGAVLWLQEWPAAYRNIHTKFATGPRATPTVDGSRVYGLGAAGMISCMDTETGEVVWQLDTIAEYGTTVPVFGISQAPLVEGDLLIAVVGGEPDAKIVAFEKATGQGWDPRMALPLPTARELSVRLPDRCRTLSQDSCYEVLGRRSHNGLGGSYFAKRPDMVGVWLGGSLPAGSADAYSDIDLKVIATLDEQTGLVAERLEMPAHRGELLFNGWLDGAFYCISHFRPFFKVDVFYLSTEMWRPSPWLKFPAKICLDRTGAVRDVIERSTKLPFPPPSSQEVSRVLSKALAGAHEVVRRLRRGELFFAQTLLEELRFHMIRLEDWIRAADPSGPADLKLERRSAPAWSRL